MTIKIVFHPTDDQDETIRNLIESGLYRDESDVLSEALQLLKDKHATLRNLIMEGENSGEPIDWSAEVFLQKVGSGKDS
ncbi:hypothetical protein BTA51_25925 [Hahella sp. CCB-MM4]|uniref:type II toxin-antitoxin system ParD family antitoxin n=1 Tax=Hahella sp. (strain CCB-MM4) TaxID=1926491 RepID=UPI000B9BB36C|nr:type II toxin-antitoxin system ParD family antitoxin [Hahella sp. CCB-MM4]OZG70409.1 hypothetical protein BTA51_25925 [Hahella sp. CCB-MM4]